METVHLSLVTLDQPTHDLLSIYRNIAWMPTEGGSLAEIIYTGKLREVIQQTNNLKILEMLQTELQDIILSIHDSGRRERLAAPDSSIHRLYEYIETQMRTMKGTQKSPLLQRTLGERMMHIL